jgi:hypothetical protein
MRFGGLFNKDRKDREFQEELESHIQMHIEDNLRLGMTPAEARRQAMIHNLDVRQSRGKVAGVSSEHAGGVDNGRLTATIGQQLDDDVLQVRVAVFTIVLSPERCVGKVIDREAWESIVPSRGQRADVSLHSLLLGGQCNDVPVPELVEDARQGIRCQLTLNVCRGALLQPGLC